MAHILIVDDDPDIAQVISLYLETDGHEVRWASNYRDGMAMALAGPTNLLILDLMMTEADDGIAMAQELRKSGFTTPILMMSSLSRVAGLVYGKGEVVVPVDDFVEKPVSPVVLIAKVNTLLNR